MTSLQQSKTTPWLSVIIPTYNGEKFLAAALDSILSQNDINNIECIIIDDGSTDNTLLILNNYKDKLPIIIHEFQHKGNWVTNTNLAISLAQGDYISFLHQDDIWLKGRLSILKKLTEKSPEIVLFLHPSLFIDEQENHLGYWQCPLPESPKIIKSIEMIEKLLIQNFISIPAPIFKRVAAFNVGKLDESLWYTGDWDFWLKIASCGDAMYYPKPLSGFRIHPNSQTVVRSSYSQDFRKQLETVYERHISSWKAPESRKKETEKIARFSIEVNSALAGFVHRRSLEYLKLTIAFLFLGPVKAYRYIKVSRIIERSFARLKAQLLA